MGYVGGGWVLGYINLKFRREFWIRGKNLRFISKYMVIDIMGLDEKF